MLCFLAQLSLTAMRDVDTYPVFRCLDKPSSFFGIRGRFGLVAGLGFFVSLVVGFFVGFVTYSLLGFVAFFFSVAVAYLVVMFIQSRYTDRAFFRMLGFWRRARYVRVKPMSVRSMLQWFM